MSDAAVKTPGPGSFLVRTLIGLMIVVVIIGVSFGGRLLPYLQSVSQLNWTPHAPNLALLADVSPAIRIHLVAVLSALAIGTALLVGVKGTNVHRTLGWMWVLLMLTGAVSAFFIRSLNHGNLSFIHLLAGWTVIVAPLGVFFARTHNVRRHSRTMTGLYVGGLIVAGLFAFMPGRLMWTMFFG